MCGCVCVCFCVCVYLFGFLDALGCDSPIYSIKTGNLPQVSKFVTL